MKKKYISESKNIPAGLYKKIVSLMPICCVDMVFWSKGKVFLFKRAYAPAKNKWWIIGGRILKGERLKDAVARKAKEEIGVDIKIRKIIGVYEAFFGTNRFDTKAKKSGAHSISICFLVEPKRKNFKLRLNDEYKDYKAINKIDKNLHPLIQTMLKDSRAIQR